MRASSNIAHPGRRIAILIVVLAAGAALLWYARRETAPVAPVGNGPAAAPVSRTALADSVRQVSERFAGAVAGSVDADERLGLTIDYLRSITYAYYERVRQENPAKSDGLLEELIWPGLTKFAESHPDLVAMAGPDGRPYEELKRYFYRRRMLLNFSVAFSATGIGRFPAIELAPIAEDYSVGRSLWGYETEARFFAVNDPIIRDIVSYERGASTGAEIMTLGDIIVHHLEREGGFIEAVRDDLDRAFGRAPPVPVDAATMAEGLAYVAMEPFLRYGPERALEGFLEAWQQTSIAHELAHVLDNRYGAAIGDQSAEGELLAYLAELRYGETPHYTLHNIYATGTMRKRKPHAEAMRMLFADFARRIAAVNKSGGGFASIDCSFAGARLTSDDVNRICYQFPRLSADEIRSLADFVFETRLRPLLEPR